MSWTVAYHRVLQIASLHYTGAYLTGIWTKLYDIMNFVLSPSGHKRILSHPKDCISDDDKSSIAIVVTVMPAM